MLQDAIRTGRWLRRWLGGRAAAADERWDAAPGGARPARDAAWPFADAFAVDLSRLAMAAPFED